VTGAVDGARKGRLTLFVGGAAAVLERAGALFAPLVRSSIAAQLGTGNGREAGDQPNLVHSSAAIGEALTLGVKCGVEPLTVLMR